jgi:glutathione S-transferase
MTHPVLWHFTFSHFAEKVRWALDWKGIPHVRRALIPGAHYARVWWLSGQATIPVLRLDGRVVPDSTAIIAALERHQPTPPLYPAGAADRRRALALEDFFDEELGHHLRRFFMAGGFADVNAARLAAAVFGSGHGAAARAMLRVGYPLLRGFLSWRFDVTPAAVERAREKVFAALDRVEREIRPSGYLVGERFSVADLTAASLLWPLANPPDFPYPVPFPPAAALRGVLGDRPALRWVATMYRDHRGASSEIAA